MINISTNNYVNGNLGPGLRQAQTYGRVKPANGIITLSLLVIGSPKVKITTLSQEICKEIRKIFCVHKSKIYVQCTYVKCLHLIRMFFFFGWHINFSS